SKLDNIADFKYAVTPGLSEFVPDNISEIIDIGYRKIDTSTITTIASKLNITDFKFNRKMIEYSEELCDKSKVITNIIKNLNKGQVHIDAILNGIDDGVIITDSNNNILHCNKFICKLLDKPHSSNIDCDTNISSSCSELLNLGESENHFMKLNDSQINIVVTKKALNVHNGVLNSIIIIKDAEKIQNIEIGIRKNLAKKGYLAKYTFNDIVYNSKAMKEVIERAKKIASLDVTTLIYGDTGTGKELIAHAIHNSSVRKDNPFLAINCAAISENLLESELFGYEEGAFTSAKKGGKKGLFDQAHNGTIFLDELSSISHQMQIKLLRVLQEREIMRVGGTTLIPINVRIIAATNENLDYLINNGAFRKDFYYRINNFTITVPPLKDRKEDIPLIIDSIMNRSHTHKKIDDELMNFLTNYKWPGNVRELKNCIEYLTFMGANKITLHDLPPTMYMEYGKQTEAPSLKVGELSNREKEIANKILEICTYRNIGRRNLNNILNEQGYDISEYKLRTLLNYLKEKNLICPGKGRGGIKLV
ncbi:MAG TPA: sigma 54-interacting transcriptional regulator, partial [Anaerovoracaceae bacterium]|nr:sigma 54-interacting transcriptional regulator [Anaerovoracaceae bacterium]